MSESERGAAASGDLELVEISSAGGIYPVAIGAGVLARLEELAPFERLIEDRTLFVISSEPILDLHRGALEPLQRRARSCRTIVVADGEAGKCPQQLTAVWRGLLEGGGKRDSVVVAFGGGSVGDLAGFAAASFLRGVELLQIPTTLLAQVDSSVGGKTGIDLEAAKNSVGAFHPPRGVLADISLLGTLSERELRAGLVETIKMAALLDAEVFARLEHDFARILEFDESALSWVVRVSVEMKAAVVEADERESGARKLLNFGHTFGHALESAAGYAGLRHGEAVAYGISFALDLASTLRDRGSAPSLLGDDLEERLRQMLELLELPPPGRFAAEDLLAAMRRDKKARDSGLTWVLPEAVGRGVLVDRVEMSVVAETIERFYRRHRVDG